MVVLANRNPAYRRYLKRFIPLTLAYVAAVALASALVPKSALATGANVMLALIPGIVVVGWIWAMARLLVELDDEYLRMLEVRKILVATALVLAVCSVWGILELYLPGLPRLAAFFVFPIWCAGLGVGALFNVRVSKG